MSKKTSAAAFLLILGTGASAIAHGGATGIVMERMEAMSAMAKAMKSMGAMVKRTVPYDAEVMKAGAEVLARHAGNNMTDLFPSDVKQKASEARDEIWQDWETFQRLASELQTLARGLGEASHNGLSDKDADMSKFKLVDGTIPDSATFATLPSDIVFGLVGKSCSGCHEKFRLKKP